MTDKRKKLIDWATFENMMFEPHDACDECEHERVCMRGTVIPQCCPIWAGLEDADTNMEAKFKRNCEILIEESINFRVMISRDLGVECAISMIEPGKFFVAAPKDRVEDVREYMARPGVVRNRMKYEVGEL